VTTRVVSVWNASTINSAIRRMYSAWRSGSRSTGRVISQIGTPAFGRFAGRTSLDGPGDWRSSSSWRWRASTASTRRSTPRTDSRYSSSLRWSALARRRWRSLASASTRSSTLRSSESDFAAGAAGAADAPAAPARRAQLGTTGWRPRNIRSNTRRGFASYGTGVSAERNEYLFSAPGQPQLERRQHRPPPDRLRRRLVHRLRRHGPPVDLGGVRRAGQVGERARLVAVQPLGPPAVGQPADQQQVVLRELQRAQDRRQLRSAPPSPSAATTRSRSRP
jgi:hypothetical protein